MAKERFSPPVLPKADASKTSALVFPERNRHTHTEPERYQRYFPGIEPAANGSSIAPPAAPVEQHVEDSQSQSSEPEDNAQAELLAAFEKAAHEGFEAGVAQAQEQTQARIDEHMAQMESMLRCIVELRTRTFEAYQEQCLELALAGAEALARAHLAQDKSAMRSLLSDAIEELSGQDAVLLHVGPASAPELQEWVNERFVDQKVQVVVESNMAPQDFRASTKTGSVTGDFEERLARLRQMVLAHRGTLANEDQKVDA